jgi:hypothetical protein
MLGYVRSCYIRLGLANNGKVILDQDRSGYVMIFQINTGYVRYGQVESR